MRIQITNGMFIALIIILVYPKAIGLTQGIMAREVGSDMWLSTILATLQGVCMMGFTVYALKRMPGMDIVHQYSQLLGKWMGKLISLVVLVFFAGAFGSVMITFVYHFMDYFLPEAPVLLFIIVPVLTSGLAIFAGFEIISRMSYVGLFSIILLQILIVFGLMWEFDVKELLPVLNTGWINTLWASRHHDTDWAVATMTAGMILPMVKEPNLRPRSAVIGILFGGFFICLWPMLEAGVLSAEVTAQYVVACMQVARTAEIGYFIHRYEMIMAALFAVPLFLQVMICLLCGAQAASRLFGLADIRKMITPVCLMYGGFAYWVVMDHSRAMDLLTFYWPPLCLTIAVWLPILLWVAGFLFKRKIPDRHITN